MSGSTSVPSIAFTSAGYVPAPESGIVGGLQSDWTAALGSNLNVTAAGAYVPPAGQLIASQAAVIGDSQNQECILFNSVDPAYSFGRMQDAIGRLSPGGGFARIPSSPTVLQITSVGGVGVVIPAGSTVVDTAGNLYAATAAITIPTGGSITAQFAATANGPIAVPATVSIYQSVPGWNTVTVASGVVGQNVESRSAFEARRNAALYANSRASIQAVTGNIWANVPGVSSVYGYSNNSPNPVTVQGVTIPANAVYVAVVGGVASAVAQAIWDKMPPGTPYYSGNTSETVYDTSAGYNPPYPSYTVVFEVPADLTIWFAVAIKSSAGVPSNASALIAAAILAALGGTDGLGNAASIGGTVFASRFYAGIAALGPWATIVSLLIGSANSAAATFTGAISSATLTVSGVSGTIVIGQAVVGTGVADGTYITAGSGTSWTVSIPQTVISEAMSSVSPTLNDLTPNINQMPTATALDVVVTLV